MSRIQGHMTQKDAIVAMCDGNPGGLSVLMQILADDGGIDPDNIMAGFGTILMLDTLGIYGCKIWQLYKDVCGESMLHTLAVLRACQLGQIDIEQINTAIDNYGRGIDVDAILADVRERLPRFGAEQVTEESHSG